MKILYFSKNYTTHDRRFLEALSNANHDLFFLTLESTPLEKRPLPLNVVPIHWQVPPNRTDNFDSILDLVPEFCQLIENVQPDPYSRGPRTDLRMDNRPFRLSSILPCILGVRSLGRCKQKPQMDVDFKICATTCRSFFMRLSSCSRKSTEHLSHF